MPGNFIDKPKHDIELLWPVSDILSCLSHVSDIQPGGFRFKSGYT
jgi:hypothetical protein